MLLKSTRREHSFGHLCLEPQTQVDKHAEWTQSHVTGCMWKVVYSRLALGQFSLQRIIIAKGWKVTSYISSLLFKLKWLQRKNLSALLLHSCFWRHFPLSASVATLSAKEQQYMPAQLFAALPPASSLWEHCGQPPSLLFFYQEGGNSCYSCPSLPPSPIPIHIADLPSLPVSLVSNTSIFSPRWT